MVVTYSEKTDEVGSWSAWQSKSQGNGRMTLTHLVAGQSVEYRLEFPDMGMTSTGRIELSPAPGGITAVMADEGELGLNPVSRWFGLFLDRIIGPDFASGLANLKKQSEQNP